MTASGSGKGIVAIKAPRGADESRRKTAVKSFRMARSFNVISQGRRTMPAYRFQVVEHDRWAIVAYLRALQR